MKFRHELFEHRSCKFKFGLVLFPNTISKRKRLIDDFTTIPHRHTKQDTHKTVSIEVIRAIVGSMVKEF